MFESSLSGKLQRIFDFDKVSFDRPGESQEQEGLFIEVESAKCRIVDGRQISRVTGTIRVFGQNNKLPYGYFSKCISEADPADTKSLFFYDFEENRGTFRNIAERAAGFLYLFDSQYDPAIGTLNQVNLSLEISE